MFKRTSRQRTLFEAGQRASESVQRRLKGTWAEGFQSRVLSILLNSEEEYASLYSDETGRPNWSVARILGVCLLQEMLDLDDQDALDSLSFDVRWQHALGLEPENAYLSRRSLVEFRSRLVAEDPEMKGLRRLFERVGDAAIAELKLSTKEQRVDSTLVTSNIFTRGRVDLFRKTLVQFFDWLTKVQPSRLGRLSPFARKWYEETKEQGWFGKLDKEKAKQQAERLAHHLYEVVRTFATDEEVKGGEPYQLVARLFDEHCTVERSEGGSAGETAKLVLKDKPEAPGSSLQSPYDPDAGYSHKGPGYLVHVAETCRNESVEILTDYDVVPGGQTDRSKDAGVIERLTEGGRQPEVLYEDGGYPTGQGLIDAAQKGTEIVAPMTGGNLPEDTIGRERFEFDTNTGHCTRCPAGHAPLRHAPRTPGKNRPPALHAYFDGAVCRRCPLQSRCIVRRPNNGKKGSLHLELGAHLIVRDRALANQREDAWWERYSIRSGIEATVSELKRAHGLGRLRVRRMLRVRLAVGLKVTACNVKRWLRGCAEVEWTRAAASAAVSALQSSFRIGAAILRRFRLVPDLIPA